MQKKVLIIGGLGFIGSQLTKDCVEKGFDVTILTKSKERLENITGVQNKVKIIIKDLKNIDKEVEGFDYIFNLAGVLNNNAIMEGKPYQDIEANCICSITLLEAIKKYNPKTRLLFVSTYFVNGNVSKLPANPKSPCNPLNLYGATKLAGENFCHIYHNIFGLDVIIARFCNVYGPNEEGKDKRKTVFNYLLRQAVYGNTIDVYNNGDFFRDYIYVTDVSQACIKLAEKGKTNKVYYVGYGKFIKFKELIDLIVKYTGIKTNPIPPPELYKSSGIKDFVCDNTPLIKLGWKAKVSPEEGIKNTVEYYKNKLNNKK